MTLDTRRIPMFAGVAALILVIAWYFLLWAPETKSLQAAHKAHAAAEQQIGQLQSQVGQLQGWVRQIPADNARFAQLQTELPDNPQIDQALNLIHQAAVASGVTVSSLAPSAPAGAAGGTAKASTGGAPSISLNMAVQGGAGQVKSFLAALQTLPRTLVIDRVSLSGTGNTTNASISARIFYAGQPTP